MMRQPDHNNAYRARFDLPDGNTSAGIFPVNRCDCPTPLVLDTETGEWLHLATWSSCPNTSHPR